MHCHFIETEVWSSWATLFRSYRDAFLVVQISFLSTTKVDIEDLFTIAIHVFGVTLIANDGVPILIYFYDDLEVVCYFISNIRGVYLPMLSILRIKGSTLAS